ncbi:hypothetical protein HWV62_17206 [Athelia sp. TMB]|nr:hypothetical protein HWV62_17206 [Athelia sp. TMB]
MAAPALHTIPVTRRPPKNWAQTANAAAFIVVFNVAAAMIHLVQLAVLLPLGALRAAAPAGWAASAYADVARECKGAVAQLLVLTTQWFAPTTLRLTFETAGQGALSPAQLETLVERDAAGRVVRLRLPEQSVLVSNHQMYADWWYAWVLTYFCGTHKDVIIVLKKSLKWVPFLGWAMQFFSFIFLARSWASDRLELASSLASLARRATAASTPLALVLYPEGTLVSPYTRPVSARYAAARGHADPAHGTLVSPYTRPVSARYAAARGHADPAHVLLPRATGLHYSLRALAPRVPALKLVDLTIVYPGVPVAGAGAGEAEYAQGFYTLRSIFFDRVPPPVVHMHVRVFDVVQDVPIGEVAAAGKEKGNGLAKAGLEGGETAPAEVEFPAAEREAFDGWLRALWADKDALIERFHATGSFGEKADATRVDVPVALKTRREALNAFAFFVPGVVGVLWARVAHLL